MQGDVSARFSLSLDLRVPSPPNMRPSTYLPVCRVFPSSLWCINAILHGDDTLHDATLRASQHHPNCQSVSLLDCPTGKLPPFENTQDQKRQKDPCRTGYLRSPAQKSLLQENRFPTPGARRLNEPTNQ